MHKGKLIFAQLKEHLPRSVFDRCVARYAGSHAPLKFSHWDQLLCMMFAQLTSREGLRDIATCLRSQSTKLYHAGFHGSISRTTLADANERRDCRIFEEFALHLIGIARPLYAKDSLAVQLAQTVYAIDASTVDLCLSLFAWAPAANARAGIKLHTLLDLRGNIPAFIRITGALVSDASFLDHLRLEAGSFYVMDRGYLHFARLIKFTHAAAFFVIRSKHKLHYRSVHTRLADGAAGVLRDEHILLTGRYTKTHYPATLRRIEFFDAKGNRTLVFLTNHFELDALQIAQLYKSRWQVELFFKWIKQNLRIKAFVGNSANAVKTQIWTAICAYVLVAIVKKRLQLTATLHTILQVLSLSLFDRIPINLLLLKAVKIDDDFEPSEQFSLFENISGQ
jgi:transposase